MTNDERTIEDLEDEYQVEKVLRGDEPISADITDVAVIEHEPPESLKQTGFDATYSVVLRTKIPAGQQFDVAITDIFDPADRNGLVTLFNSLGISPGEELSGLLDERVGLSLASDGQGDIQLYAADNRINANLLDNTEYHAERSTAPDPLLNALSRGYNYHQRGDRSGVSVQVADTAVGDDELVVSLADG